MGPELRLGLGQSSQVVSRWDWQDPLVFLTKNEKVTDSPL